jgi:uncharacterized protein YbjT (DUF2867 family)
VSIAAAPELVLLTGATGYVGGRLLGALERRGCAVRCLARRPEFLRGRAAPSTEVVAGDVLDAATLPAALRGVGTAYYLVHSLGSARGFEEEDRRAAGNFGATAHAAGVRRIVYLGGLGDEPAGLSSHLKSRQEVGAILRASGVPLVEFRASIVIGSGSLSFEMIRALVERLPIMITPRWVATTAQPIAVGDLIEYLLAALDLPDGPGRVYEIGGADRVSYGELMREYARQRGLRRLMIPVPILTPRLSSLWLGLVTPLYARVGRKLIDSMRNATVVKDDAAARDFGVRPRGCRDAIATALRHEDRELAETRWSDPQSAQGRPRTWAGIRFGTRLVDSRAVHVEVPPASAFAPIRRIGGDTGWYYADWLWRLRGALDLLIGGAGLRRGRRDPERLVTGDALDFWRVEAFEPGRRLRLAAEMRLPGRAWLEFEVTPDPGAPDAGDVPDPPVGSIIRQTAIFDPVGLSGLVYWYGIYPIHTLVFAGMLRGVAAAARSEAGLLRPPAGRGGAGAPPRDRGGGSGTRTA